MACGGVGPSIFECTQEGGSLAHRHINIMCRACLFVCSVAFFEYVVLNMFKQSSVHPTLKYLFTLGANRNYQGPLQLRSGPPRTIVRAIQVQVTFQEFPKYCNNWAFMFSGRNCGETIRVLWAIYFHIFLVQINVY